MGNPRSFTTIHRVRIGKVTFRRPASSRILAEFNPTTNRLLRAIAGPRSNRVGE